MSSFTITEKDDSGKAYKIEYISHSASKRLQITHNNTRVEIETKDLVANKEGIYDLIRKKAAHDAELQAMKDKLKTEIDRLQDQIKVLREVEAK